MTDQYDAIIIGAGIIGCGIAFETAKKGYKTLNIDKLPASGYGSTSNSCAIIRFHYSTADGVAMAREGYYYWLDWAKYLETGDERGLAKYVSTGCLVVKTKRNKHLKQVMTSLDDLGIEFEEMDAITTSVRFPFIDARQYGPPKLKDDPGFGQPTGEAFSGAIYLPESGYITDPQLSTHNLQVAAEAKGGKFMFNAEVVEILKKDGRVSGVALKDETRIEAPR